MSYVDTCENSRLVTVSHELEKATLLGGFFFVASAISRELGDKVFGR